MSANVAVPESEYALGASSNRFANTLLYKFNAKYARPGEMLCNPITGATFIRHVDGTTISIDELTRFRCHYSEFLQYCSLVSLSSDNISKVKFDELNMPCFIVADNVSSIIPEEITIADGSMSINKFAISIDIDTIKVENAITDSSTKLTNVSGYEPKVVMKYSVDGVTKNITLSLSQINNYTFTVNSSSVVIKSIKLVNTNPNDVKLKYILHSMLICGGVQNTQTELIMNTKTRPITPLEILMAYIFGSDVPNLFDSTVIYSYGDLCYKISNDKLVFYRCNNPDSRSYPLIDDFIKYWVEIDPSSYSSGFDSIIIDPETPTQGGIWVKPTNSRYLNLGAIPSINIE